MNLRYYLIIMSLGTLLCWFAWSSIVYSLDPFAAGILALSFFYGSLFLALLGTFSVLGFVIRRMFIKQDEIVFRHVRRTFRQGVIIATTVIIALLFLHLQLLYWWNSLLLVALAFILEAVFFTSRKYRNQDYVAS
jgi:Ca2+/Na+ antiporter